MKVCRLILLVPLLASGFLPAAFADLGQMLLHRTSGPFDITVFAAPEPLSTGDADLSVLIQQSISGQPVLDADTSLTLVPPAGLPSTFRLSRNAGNRLMRSVNFHFNQPGLWHLSILAERGEERSSASAAFNVGASRSRSILVWTFVSLPMVLIVLFATHQRFKTVAR